MFDSSTLTTTPNQNTNPTSIIGGNSADVYRTTNSLSSIAEEDRRTQTSTGGSYSKVSNGGIGNNNNDNRGVNSYSSASQQHRGGSAGEQTPQQQTSQTVYRSINVINEEPKQQQQQQQRVLSSLSSNGNYPTTQQIPHHDLIVLNELEHFLQRSLIHHRTSDNTIDWTTIRAEYTQHPDRPELMRRYVASLLDERARASTKSSNNTIKPTSTTTSVIAASTISRLPGTPVGNDEEKLKAVDDFVDSVINRKRQKETDRSLRLLDLLLEKLVERRREDVSVSETELRGLEAYVQQMRTNHPSRHPGNKIIIRTTRKLPAKVYITGGDGRNLVRKKITYSYLDNYRPTTRVYEVAGNSVLYNDAKGAPMVVPSGPGVGANPSSSSAQTAAASLSNMPTHTIDLFNAKNSLNYLVKPFDAHIAESIGKPSHEQINKYLSVINTGVKNPDLIQIHPLLNNKTEIRNQPGPDTTTSKNKTY